MKLTRRDFFKATLTVPVGLALPCAVKAKADEHKDTSTSAQLNKSEEFVKCILAKIVSIREKHGLIPKSIIVNRLGYDLIEALPYNSTLRPLLSVRLKAKRDGLTITGYKFVGLDTVIVACLEIYDRPVFVVRTENPYHEPVFGYMGWNENL